MGENCPARLPDLNTLRKVTEMCKFCQELQVKKRRKAKEEANIIRWARDGPKFSASINKAQNEVHLLTTQIADLESKRTSVALARRQDWDPDTPVYG